MSRSGYSGLVAVACIVLAACGAGATTPPSGAPSATANATANAPKGFPVTVQNCGRQLTFDRPPSRAYLGYQAAAEMFIGLGLADHAVARKKLAQPPLPEQAAAFARIPANSVDPYKLPDKEKLISLRPDFLLAFVEFGKGGGAAGVVTLDDLATVGTPVYQVICPDTPGHAGGRVDDAYRALHDLGAIFGVPDRAAERIAAMRQQIANVQAKVAGRPPVKVLYYGGGEGPLSTVGSDAMLDEMIELAGGTNVFHDTAESYFDAPLEGVSATSPEVFLINRDTPEEGNPDTATNDQAKAEYLYKTFPNMPASRVRRVTFTTYVDTSAGWRFAQTVEDLARALHPDAFAQ